jgi:hypothetical protein
MSILNTLRSRYAKRQERKREAYAEERGFATAEELEEMKESAKLRRRGGMGVGKGRSPTGTSIDFEADQKPPRY